MESAKSATLVAARASRRRQFHRRKLHGLAYVNLDQANGGIIRNVSEGGIAVQAVGPIAANQLVRVRFELLNPRTRVEINGRVVWTDSRGQAGLEFVELPHRSRRFLRDWMLTQILAGADPGMAASFFSPQAAGQDALGWRISPGARSPGRLETERRPAIVPDSESRVRNPLGLPFTVSQASLAMAVDCLILMAAVLLFAIISVAMTKVFPSWPVATVLALIVSCVFGMVYWYLFATWMGASPGEHLAGIAAGDQWSRDQETDQARFR